jgi:hypothetical protein
MLSRPVEGEAENGARARILHAARLPGSLANHDGWLERDAKERVMRVRLPNRAIRPSWRGLEVAEEAGKSSEHRDQLLSTLAECGVPLDAVIDTREGPYPVREMLRTSINAFHTGQREISWTATAYACYLPPQSTWTNRDGERFSFDGLVDAIIRRSLSQESCSGIHMMLVLTKLLRIDREMKILDPRVRMRLEAYLRRRIAEAVDSQLADGSWPMRWSPTGFGDAAFTPMATGVNRMIVSGHLVEWFHLLPDELKPPTRVVKAACSWIWSQLQATPGDTIVNNFCPYTHAVIALELTASP